MKKIILLTLLCACVCAYGVAATTNVARPPHKLFRSSKTVKVKKVKVHGYDRAKSAHKVRRVGYDYYKYANRPSYLRMMGKAINGNRYWAAMQ